MEPSAFLYSFPTDFEDHLSIQNALNLMRRSLSPLIERPDPGLLFAEICRQWLAMKEDRLREDEEEEQDAPWRESLNSPWEGEDII